MVTFIILFLIIVAIVLMAVVLMQSSKGNGLAGPIGGSSVTMAFGVRRTSDLLSKSTSVLAAVLMVGCIAVNLMIGGTGTLEESPIQKNAGQQQSLPPGNLPPVDNNVPAPTDQSQPPVDQSQQPPDPNKDGGTKQKVNDAPKNNEPQGP